MEEAVHEDFEDGKGRADEDLVAIKGATLEESNFLSVMLQTQLNKGVCCQVKGDDAVVEPIRGGIVEEIEGVEVQPGCC